MGVTVDVLTRDYKYQLSNGDDFSLSSSNSSDHFAGNVMEQIRATFEVQVFTLTQLVGWEFRHEGATGGILIQDSINFLDEGFFEGDEIILRIQAATPATTGTVSFAGDGEIRFIDMTDRPVEGSFAGTGGPGDWLKSSVQLPALAFSFGLIEQDENVNYLSKITETQQTWLMDEIDTNFTEAVSKGTQEIRGWLSGAARCKFLEARDDYLIPLTSTSDSTVFVYEIQQDFIILPYFLNGELPNLQNTVPPDLFAGQPTLRHVTRYDFRDSLNNPNTSKTGEDDESLGSVGWFNESFNGFPVEFSFSDLVYKLSGDVVTEIQAGKTTVVTFTITADNPILLAATPFIIYHSILPGLNTYKFSKDNFKTTWIYDAVRGDSTGTTQGDPIKNVEATLISTTQLDVTFEVTYTQDQLDRLADGEDYIIGVGVGDNALSVNDSNKVTLLLDTNKLVKNSDIEGLITFNKLNIYGHGQTFGSSTPSQDGKLWDEDGVLIEYEFDLNSADEAILEDLEVNLIANNPITGESFTIQQNAIDLSEAVYTEGVLTISVDGRRGFLVPVNDQNNWDKIEK